MQTVLSHIVDFCPDYFRLENVDTNPVVLLHEAVPCWSRFRELVTFFGWTLTDVADRWADGKGPLAMHFTGDEVKKLVVAMFENTSRREALLMQLSRRPSVHLS